MAKHVVIRERLQEIVKQIIWCLVLFIQIKDLAQHDILKDLSYQVGRVCLVINSLQL